MAKPIPDTITAEHIREAIRLLDAGHDHSFGKATKFELEYEGRRYAPKVVVGVAWEIAEHRKVGPYDFSSGEGSGNAVGFLKRLGFHVTATYLFTVKIEEWGWRKFSALQERWLRDPQTTEGWSSGNSKSIAANTPFFLLKQGDAPTGIIASGRTASGHYRGPHWDGSGKEENYNDLRFDYLFDPRTDGLLPAAQIQMFGKKYWASRSSGVVIAPEVAHEFDVLWRRCLKESGNESKSQSPPPSLDAADADDRYTANDEDNRASALKHIKLRRGQKKFRDKQIKNYGGKCSISGCDVLDVLEAAHIKSYLGERDHHEQNGLLLRADLHTLFDLTLLGIEPSTLTIRLHPSLLKSDYAKLDGIHLRKASVSPSLDALTRRWREFQAKIAFTSP